MPRTQDPLACLRCGGPEKWDRQGSTATTATRLRRSTDKAPGKPDGYDHRGFWIATLVSPKDCSRCHKEQFDQQQVSHHAKAADILNSSDNYLGTVVGGPAAVNTGCRQCHGSNIKVLKDGKLDPDTWPNTGIGRINPDGSKGSCSACHTRHRFSKEQARRPDACGKCHLGPDHPQIEVFNESKHGILYQAFRDKMNMDKGEWVVGVDYQDSATCATCHIGATPNQAGDSRRGPANLLDPAACGLQEAGALERPTGQNERRVPPVPRRLHGRRFLQSVRWSRGLVQQ